MKRIKPDIFMIQETKQEMLGKKEVGSTFGTIFKEWIFAPSSGKSGGLAMIWNRKAVDIVDWLMGEFSIPIKIERYNGSEWWLSSVYGPCRPKERTDFWLVLASLCGLVVLTDLLLCEGRFQRCSVSIWKINWGKGEYQHEDHQKFHQRCWIKGSRLVNVSFTWSNLREESICCRMDKFLFSNGWEDFFSFFQVKGLG